MKTKKKPQNEQVFNIVLCELCPDNNNRKIGGFDQVKLEQLAESIRAVGVQQPAVVRKIKGPDCAILKYEIVAGERRWRAAKLAGLDSLPCVVRDLDDVTVLKIRTIENLQRENVHPLDEADGYARLLDQAIYDAEHLAQEIGRSMSYIYQRIKLLDLIPQAREMLAKGKLAAGHAILIARLGPDQQKEVLQSYLFHRGGDGPSVRDLDEFIHERILMELNKTSFKKDDADLIPKAGSCKTCLKRSGSQPALFADVCKKDYCLDPTCFKAKLDAMVKRERALLFGTQHLLVCEGYTREKNVPKEALDRYDWHECKQKESGAVRCLVVDGVGRGRLTWGKKRESQRYELTPQEKAANEKKKRNLQLKRDVKTWLYSAVVEELQNSKKNLSIVELWRVLAAYAWKRLEGNNQVRLAKLEKWEKPTKKKGVYGNGIDEQGHKIIQSMTMEGLILFMVKVAMVGELDVGEYWDVEPKNLHAAAQALRLNPKVIETAAAENLRAETKAKQKAPANKKGRKKAKK